MTKKKEELQLDDAISLAEELTQAFRKSEAYSKAKDDNYFAATFVSGIALFTAGILKSLCLSSSQMDDDIYNAYVEHILPEAFRIVGKTVDTSAAIQEILQQRDEVGS